MFWHPILFRLVLQDQMFLAETPGDRGFRRWGILGEAMASIESGFTASGLNC